MFNATAPRKKDQNSSSKGEFSNIGSSTNAFFISKNKPETETKTIEELINDIFEKKK